MKQFAFLLIVSIICAKPNLLLAQRNIESVSITLNTTNDDKDFDTFIRFQLQSADGSWIATNEGRFGGTFPEGSTYTFPLKLGNSHYPEKLLLNTFLYAYINPVGNDTWSFTWQLVVNLDDGTRMVANGQGGLSESRNSFKLRAF